MGRKEKRRLNRLINRINTEETPVPEVIRLQTDGFNYAEKLDPGFASKNPQISELQSLKEEFIDMLNAVFAKYERSLQKVVYERGGAPAILTIISTEQKVHLMDQVRRSFDIDQSAEMRSILMRRSQLFIERLLWLVRSGNEEQKKNVLTASTQLVRVLGKELDLSTRILFEKESPNAVTFERFIVGEFRKTVSAQSNPTTQNDMTSQTSMTSDNRTLEDLLSEIIDDNTEKKTTKKKPPQKPVKEDVSPEDREFEDFRVKLESAKIAKVRVKPRIGDKWMSHLCQQVDLIRAESCKS